MVVVLKYKNNIEIDEMLLPIIRRKCMSNNLEKICKHNGKICGCVVFAGNTKLPILYEDK